MRADQLVSSMMYGVRCMELLSLYALSSCQRGHLLEYIQKLFARSSKAVQWTYSGSHIRLSLSRHRETASSHELDITVRLEI